MTKRILFAVMCTCLLLMVVMTGIVIGKVNALLSVAQPPQGTPNTMATEPSTTAPPETTLPPETDPPEPPHEHEFVRVESIEPTCTSFGYNVYACPCGKTHMPSEEFVQPLGHDYVEGEPVARTCTEDGYTPIVCSRCQDDDKRDVVLAEGHVLGEATTYEPHCADEGYTTAFCSVCQQDVIYDIVEAPGHAYGDWATATEPGDATPGIRQRICGTCSDVDEEWIQPQGTLEIKDQSKEAMTDDEDVIFYRYVVTVGTELTPGAYTYTVDAYLSDNLTFSYGENGLSVFVEGFPEDELKCLAPYEDGQWTLKIEPQPNPDQDDPLQGDQPE